LGIFVFEEYLAQLLAPCRFAQWPNLLREFQPFTSLLPLFLASSPQSLPT
jgi:hypothetical protein